MQMAMAVGGCTGDDADLLRRAMGSKRGVEKIERAARPSCTPGWPSTGSPATLADEIYTKIEAFANFGFAESHSISFALLVYASSWLRLHYPARVPRRAAAGPADGVLLPAVAGRRRPSARRRGTPARHPALRQPMPGSSCSTVTDPARPAMPACLDADQPTVGEFDPDRSYDFTTHRRDGSYAVRLGLAGVTSVGAGLADRIVECRDADGPYLDMADLVRRVGLTTAQVEALATAGAFDTFGLSRRQAIWNAGQAATEGPGQLPGTTIGRPSSDAAGARPARRPPWPTSGRRASRPTTTRSSTSGRCWTPAGCCPLGRLAEVEPGTRIRVGGVVTHRQRPGTAGGIDVPQPRGRDRDGQRDLLARRCGTASAGSPGSRRRWSSGGSWSATTGRSTWSPTRSNGCPSRSGTAPATSTEAAAVSRAAQLSRTDPERKRRPGQPNSLKIRPPGRRRAVSGAAAGSTDAASR